MMTELEQDIGLETKKRVQQITVIYKPILEYTCTMTNAHYKHTVLHFSDQKKNVNFWQIHCMNVRSKYKLNSNTVKTQML